MPSHWEFSLQVVFLTITAFHSAASFILRSDCPCTDQSLCQPITAPATKQVFIFVPYQSNKPWLDYDWTKVTTLVTVRFEDSSLMCLAHQHGVRISRLVNFPVSQLTNSTCRKLWIKELIDYTKKHHYDGVNIDFESPIYSNQTVLRNGLTDLVNKTYQAFKALNPNMQVTFDVAWSPHCIDERCFDAFALSHITDFLFVMAYDERSQIHGACVAGPNSDVNTTVLGLKEYLKLGIPNRKLVLGLPWYGYNYPCVNMTKDGICFMKKISFRGANCSDAAGKQYDYSTLVTIYLNMSTTGRMWDSASQSPYFNFKNAKTGQIHQVWYDDPQSLAIKYKIADSMGLLGVGMWHANCVSYLDNPQAKQDKEAMWGALPIYK